MKPMTSGDFDPYLDDWNQPDQPETKGREFSVAFAVGFVLSALIHTVWSWLF